MLIVHSLQSQSFFRGYRSILPTSLAYFTPQARGFVPKRPDAVVSTIARDANDHKERTVPPYSYVINMVPNLAPHLGLTPVRGDQVVQRHRQRRQRKQTRIVANKASPRRRERFRSINLMTFPIRNGYDRLTCSQILYLQKPILHAPIGSYPICCYCYQDQHHGQLQMTPQPTFDITRAPPYKSRLKRLKRFGASFKHSPFSGPIHSVRKLLHTS